MPSVSLSDIFDIGIDVLSTELNTSNGVCTVQLGNVVDSDVGSGAVNEMWFPANYFARPSKPDVGSQASQAVAIKGGATDVVIAVRDTRLAEAYGNQKEGEFCLVAGGSDAKAQGKIIGRADGALVLATTDNNTHEGNGVYLIVGPDKLAFQAPWGSLVFDKTGFHVVTHSGAKMSLGGISNPAQPNYFRVDACSVALDSPQVLLGPTATNGGTGLFLAPVVAPVASPEPGTPVPVAAGVGVSLGITAQHVFTS